MKVGKLALKNQGDKQMVMKQKIFVSILFVSLLLLTSLNAFDVMAQGNATVTVLDSTGGTTDPTGTTTYADGTDVQLTATSDPDYAFTGWTVTTDSSSSNYLDNPLTITVSGGVTYTVQPVFQFVQPPPGRNLPTDLTSAAIVVVLAAAGGTSTPAPGTYASANAALLTLTAKPNSGWQFVHWTICGSNMNHGGYPLNYMPSDNPYTVDHGYGYTYYYQPVFAPVGTSETTPTPSATEPTVGGMTTNTWIIIGLVVVIIVILVAFGAFALRRRK
jgi:hypothetical protein